MYRSIGFLTVRTWGGRGGGIFVNETNLVHVLFLVYFVNFIYNLYMFRISLGLSRSL